LGPLHGLPVLHKDLFAVRGMRTTLGSPLFRDHVPDADSLIVRRWRAAGAISLGKTNTPEFGAGAQTFNTVFGATRNPYDLAKTCGGSSGGSAVALACGMAPLADGTDSGGSLRIPAAFCNVVGMRPSIGRVPEPEDAFGWSAMNTGGCLARNVEDLALGLSAIAGPHPLAPMSIQEPGSVFAHLGERDFKGVRVAWYRNLGGLPIEGPVKHAVERQRKVFEELGCVVEEDEPDFGAADEAFRILRLWHSAFAHGEKYRRHPWSLKKTLRREVRDGLRLRAMDVARGENARVRMWREFQRFFERYEFFVLPATQVAPFAVEVPFPMEIEGVALGSYIDWFAATWYISITGHPAISVPAGFTREGSPTGLQIVGRAQADGAVLQLARAYEAATDFGKRQPERS
jgi:amidase